MTDEFTLATQLVHLAEDLTVRTYGIGNGDWTSASQRFPGSPLGAALSACARRNNAKFIRMLSKKGYSSPLPRALGKSVS